MKKVIAATFGLVLLVGGSIAFAGGYTHTSDDEDQTEQSQDLESHDEAETQDGDGPGQQVATGDEYDGEGPRGLEVAQIAIADHKGDLPAGLEQAIANATLDRSADHARGGAPDAGN